MQHVAYSYRSDASVPPFDDSEPIIIFDGVCVLCSSGVQWMLKRDPSGRNRFAAIQDAVPQALYRHYGLDAARFDTFMVLSDGLPSTKWAGLLAAGRTMPAPWRWISILGQAVPNALGDQIYDWVQRNCITWFGSRQECLLPSPAHRRRFLNQDEPVS
jgi:predicted DCC family thiol-disulfide oxidoreductase YuxK